MSNSGEKTPQKPKNKGGRPAFKPTDQQRALVRLLAGFGMEQPRICMAVTAVGQKPLKEKALRRHFKAELHQGGAQLEAQLITTAVSIATKKEKDGTAWKAVEFLLCARFGYSKYAAPPLRPGHGDEAGGEEEDEGKKAMLNRQAGESGDDQEWGELLNPRARPN